MRGRMADLWQNQVNFIARADVEPNVAAFMDPGTGKTRALIEVLRRDFNRNKRIKKTLIICPLSTCKQWKRAFDTYSKIPQEKILILTGPTTKRIAKLEKFKDGIVITNFEGIRQENYYAALLHWSPEIVSIDESHWIKDSGSKTAKKIYPLAHAAGRRFILTGTPVLNELLDLFGQYKALDPNLFGASFFKFRARFFFDKNAHMPRHIHFPDWRPLPNAEKLIGDIIAKTAVFAKKSECLDLPPLVSEVYPIELSHDQRRAYDQMESEFVTDLNGVTAIAEFAMTKTLRMQQILAGFLSAEAGTEPAFFEPNNRLNATRDILESLKGKQVIIWTNFTPTYALIKKLCEDMGRKPVMLTGDETITEKEESIRAFNRGEADTIISNPAAGGTGVDGLQVCCYTIYYTRGFNAAHYYQSRDRNHRGGSEVHEKVTHFHLVADGTVDDTVCQALINKQKIGDALSDWIKKGGQNDRQTEA